MYAHEAEAGDDVSVVFFEDPCIDRELKRIFRDIAICDVGEGVGVIGVCIVACV